MKQGNVICFILKQQTTNDIEKCIRSLPCEKKNQILSNYRTDKFVRVRYHFLSVLKCHEQVFRGHNIVIRIYEKNDIGFSLQETTKTDANIHM